MIVSSTFNHERPFNTALEGNLLKKHAVDREMIYVCINHSNHVVLSHGIEFSEFLTGLPEEVSNMLLLKHQFEEGHFNMHLMLDYADSEMIGKLVEDDVHGYGDFCWIDFIDEEGLYQLTGQEIAEILYLSHLKDHLRLPFYSKLSNQYVYLAGDDGWFNKTYYKSWDHFYSMLGSTISGKITIQKDKSFLNRWKKKKVTAIPAEILHPFIHYMKQGMVISIEKAVRNRLFIEVPVWVVGDYYDMDAMYEEYEQLITTQKPNGKIVFDRKSEEWHILTNDLTIQDVKRGTTFSK